ncbi:MAG: DUF4184 family protein [Pseudomonadota bacterium]|nr:DUF4184 family protein [Pseudomonadota bacterium]
MPFTLAHPVAALPIWYASGRRLRLAALVIGSTAPDYEYFLRMQPGGSFAHTIPGLFLFCLPAAWLVLWLFDRFARRGVQTLLPSGWQLPLAPGQHRHSALATAGALLLGAASHVIWDAFTHRTGLGVMLLPGLSAPVPVGFWSVPLYKLLQHGSTVAGVLVLSTLAIRWARCQPSVPLGRLAMCALLLVGIPLAVGVLNGLRFLSQGFQPFVVATGVAFTFAVAVGPVLLGALKYFKREDAA